LLTIHARMQENSRLGAVRLVVWSRNSQSSWLGSARIWSRCQREAGNVVRRQLSARPRWMTLPASARRFRRAENRERFLPRIDDLDQRDAR